MTEQELIAEISLVTTAISKIIQTGEKYEIHTGSSKRIFEADLDKWRDYRRELNRELAEVTGTSGVVTGF